MSVNILYYPKSSKEFSSFIGKDLEWTEALEQARNLMSEDFEGERYTAEILDAKSHRTLAYVDGVFESERSNLRS